MMTDNVQKQNNCINIPYSQIFWLDLIWRLPGSIGEGCKPSYQGHQVRHLWKLLRGHMDSFTYEMKPYTIAELTHWIFIATAQTRNDFTEQL
jgi:hypothetical protein